MASGNSIISTTGGGVVQLRIEWWTTPNNSPSKPQTRLQANLYLVASMKGTARGYFGTGPSQTYSKTLTDGTQKKNILATYDRTFDHNKITGEASSVILWGSLDWNGYVNVNGTRYYLSSLPGKLTIPIAPISVRPEDIASASVTPTYEVGVTQTITWSAAARAARYELQHRAYDIGLFAWGEWKNTNISSPLVTSHSFVPTQNILGDLNRGAIQWRVRAISAGGTASNWKETNVAEHYGVRVWNGSDWVWGKLRIWNGSDWVKEVPKVYRSNGWTHC